MKKVKMAVIGYGHLGRWHSSKVAANERAELVAIVEPNDQSAQQAKLAHPEVKVVSSIEQVLDDIDAAAIVTPTSTHFELTKFLLQKNKHVFCEKPLCSTLAEANDLKKYLRDGLVMQVGHSERCHKAWEILKEEIKKINSPFTFKIERVAPFKGRATDVDVVQDLMIHDLDLLSFLMDKDVSSVQALGHKIRTSKWDQVNAILSLRDGSKAIITSGRNHVHEVRSLEITHDQGCIYVDMFANRIKIATAGQFENGEFVKELDYEKRDHLALEHEAFYLSILENRPVMVSYEQGVKAVGMVEQVLSALENQTQGSAK